MRRIRYGVAMSLDGYIAGPQDDYDWIPMDPDIDFAAMMAQFDTYLMGRRSYERTGMQASKMTVWVFSTTLRQEDHPHVTIVNDHIPERLNELRSRPGKDIALFGGGLLARSLFELGQVDTVEVAVLPILLGGGIPLLPSPAARQSLTLTRHTLYPKTGTLLLEYSVQKEKAKRSVGRKQKQQASA